MKGWRGRGRGGCRGCWARGYDSAVMGAGTGGRIPAEKRYGSGVMGVQKGARGKVEVEKGEGWRRKEMGSAELRAEAGWKRGARRLLRDGGLGA